MTEIGWEEMERLVGRKAAVPRADYDALKVLAYEAHHRQLAQIRREAELAGDAMGELASMCWCGMRTQSGMTASCRRLQDLVPDDVPRDRAPYWADFERVLWAAEYRDLRRQAFKAHRQLLLEARSRARTAGRPFLAMQRACSCGQSTTSYQADLCHRLAGVRPAVEG